MVLSRYQICAVTRKTGGISLSANVHSGNKVMVEHCAVVRKCEGCDFVKLESVEKGLRVSHVMNTGDIYSSITCGNYIHL
jgi:hypothetical protein